MGTEWRVQPSCYGRGELIVIETPAQISEPGCQYSQCALEPGLPLFEQGNPLDSSWISSSRASMRLTTRKISSIISVARVSQPGPTGFAYHRAWLRCGRACERTEVTGRPHEPQGLRSADSFSRAARSRCGGSKGRIFRPCSFRCRGSRVTHPRSRDE